MFSAASVCLWVGLCVCGFVCQHDNYRTSKHRMMKLGGGVGALHKNFGRTRIWVSAPAGMRNLPKCGVLLSYDAYDITRNVNKAMRSDETSHRTHRAHGTCVRLRRWENQRSLSSSYLLWCCKIFAYAYVRVTPDQVGLQKVAEKFKKYDFSALLLVGGFEVNFLLVNTV